jgi:hypothetical protein
MASFAERMGLDRTIATRVEDVACSLADLRPGVCVTARRGLDRTVSPVLSHYVARITHRAAFRRSPLQ